MALHKFTPDEIEVLDIRESPDPTLNRQYFRVSFGRNRGRCYIENPANLSEAQWRQLVAGYLNTAIQHHGRWVFAELCDTPGGLALNVPPGERTDASFRVYFRERPPDGEELTRKIAEKARALVRIVGCEGDMADFVFADKTAEDARGDLTFAQRVILGDDWADRVTFPNPGWSSDMPRGLEGPP